MQHLLTEEERASLVPKESYNKLSDHFEDVHRRLLALGAAVNAHPNSEQIWKAQQEILEREVKE